MILQSETSLGINDTTQEHDIRLLPEILVQDGAK